MGQKVLMCKDRTTASVLAKTNFRLFEIFAAAVEEGSMSAAGQKLKLSQAAVSQSITILEQALSVTLFDRSVRPPVLTLLGKSAIKTTTEILAKMRELEDTMRYRAAGRVPVLRIGMLDSFSSTAGAAMLNNIKDVAREWTMVSGPKETSFQALVDRRMDIIVTSDHSRIPDEVDARTILTENFLLAVPPNYKGDVTKIKTLFNELDFVRYGSNAPMASLVDGHLTRMGVQPTSRYFLDTTVIALRMVSAGFGWTVTTPLIYLKSMLPQDSVRIEPLPGPPLRRKLLVAMRRGESEEAIRKSMHSAALKALREVVLHQITALLPDYIDQFVIAQESNRQRNKKAVA